MTDKALTRMDDFRKGVWLAAVVLLLATTANGGVMFFAGQWTEGRFIPDEDVKGPAFGVRYCTISVTIDGARAETRVEEKLTGLAGKAGKILCVVPLPEGARKEGMLGLAPSFRRAAGRDKYLKADEAQKLYEALAKATGNVGILALTGRPAIVTDQFPPTGWLDGKVTVTYRFRQSLTRRGGVLSYECPMPATGLAKRAAARVSLSATVKSKLPLRAIFSPTHTAAVERRGLYEARVRVKADNLSGDDDFRLCWAADTDDLGLRVIAYRADGDEDGYFMLVGNPTGGAAGTKAIDKDVLFVLDTSGSMRGEKIEQARSAIDYCLGRLNRGDRFNIITFGTDVSSFRDRLAANGKATLAAARGFIEEAVARGRTNIGGALAEALAGEPAKARPRIVIFLTDGTPTAGELVPDKIVESVKEAAGSAQIFVMGVGHGVNAHLLDKLAEATNGSSEYVAPREEIDVKVAALYDRLSEPVLTDVAVAFGELPTHSVYPKKLLALFKGSDLMVFGRYRKGGRHTFTVSGTLRGKPASYTCTAELPAKPAGGKDDFVAPLWAARKIGYLLQELRLHGENKELIEEVVLLSRKYGIVTEYTQFIASAGGAMKDELVVAEAHRRMREANRDQTGQWAVNQAGNDRALQMRMVANHEANTFVDRRGRVVTNDFIRQIGRRVFYLRDGQWADAEEAGDRKTRVVKLYSKEYFGLLRNSRDFARAQKLGWAMSMNLGNERVVIENDGKLKDEKLRPKPAPEGSRRPSLPQQNLDQRVRQLQQQTPNRAVPNNDAELGKEAE